jgi:hypothetical protein
MMNCSGLVWIVELSSYPGIFQGCLGVGDVKEFEVVKFDDTVKERCSFNEKMPILIFFSVIDPSG